MSTLEQASLAIDGMELEVVALRGREALGEPFQFAVTCRWGAGDAEPARLVHANALLRFAAVSERVIHGIVQRAVRRVHDDGDGELEVVVVPHAFPLTLGRSARTFRDASVIDIVDVVFGDLPHRWELVSRYEKRDYCAQYREDDWSFALRLLEEEGIHLWFDHESGSSIVLSDASVAAADIAGGASVPFAPESGLDAHGEVIFELFRDTRAVPDRQALRSFDPRRPALVIEGSMGEGPIEHYDAPGGGPRSPERAARRARLMAEAAAVLTRGFSGATNCMRLVPGRAVETSGHPLSRYDGRYFVVAASHELAQRRRAGGDAAAPSYRCRFDAIGSDVVYRPPTRTPHPRQAGLQSGVVVGAAGEEIRPDAEGRVRVQLHWDREGRRDEHSGHWLRVAQRGTADSMLLPRMGWNVLTFNEEGSVDDPSLLSRIHDAEHPPSHGLPDNQTRVVFRTATSPGDGTFNELYFEDTKGAEEMHMQASLDLSRDTLNHESWQIGNDHTRAIANEQRVAIGTDKSERVDGDQLVQIGSNELLTVVGNRAKSVGGNESETVAAERSLHVGAGHTNNVTGNRTLEVGSALIDATLGPITSSAGTTHHVMVGGVALKVTAKNMAESAGMGAVQTIGGAKIEIAKGARKMTAKLIHAETVGGTMVHKTAGSWSTTTTTGTSMRVGGLLAASSPTLTLEATAKIVLRCGGSTITITPSDVVVAAPALDVTDSKLLDAVTGRIDHN